MKRFFLTVAAFLEWHYIFIAFAGLSIVAVVWSTWFAWIGWCAAAIAAGACAMKDKRA
jgi:hypothetical protein